VKPADVARTAELIAQARSLLVITGAGISADSGLPTYRGVSGLYHRGLTEEGYPIEEALSGWILDAHPEICWKYMLQIERACRGALPNRAHQAIVALERRLPRVWVLTQNVDGLHRAAGTTNLIEIHGNFNQLRCTRCDWRAAGHAATGMPPRCPDCGEVVRPEVVLFGELLPRAALSRLYVELETGFDLVMSVGTSSLFPYIAEPVARAAAQGLPTVEINPDDTPVSALVDIHLRAGAQAAFDAIMARLDPD